MEFRSSIEISCPVGVPEFKSLPPHLFLLDHAFEGVRLAVVSDIHSNIAAFQEVLGDIGADRVICAGDLVGYYLHPGDVVEEIKQRGINCVRGNHDHAAVNWPPARFNSTARKALQLNREMLEQEHLSFLEELPTRHDFKFDSRKVTMVHGAPEEPDRYVYPRDVDTEFLRQQGVADRDIVVMGHTHVPLVKQVKDTLVLNPGSVGQPRDGDPRPSFAVVDTGSMEVEVLRKEYEPAEVVAEVEESELPDSLGKRLLDGR